MWKKFKTGYEYKKKRLGIFHIFLFFSRSNVGLTKCSSLKIKNQPFYDFQYRDRRLITGRNRKTFLFFAYTVYTVESYKSPEDCCVFDEIAVLPAFNAIFLVRGSRSKIIKHPKAWKILIPMVLFIGNLSISFSTFNTTKNNIVRTPTVNIFFVFSSAVPPGLTRRRYYTNNYIYIYALM